MHTLVVSHQGRDGDDHSFRVQRVDRNGIKATPGAVVVPSPIGWPVEGRPNDDLMGELRWYLESFLGYPFDPETEHAERVQAALKAWGTAAFNALFGDRDGIVMFHDATRLGYENLHLQISSDDPVVLGWPWEALLDPQAAFLAQTCQIERRLNNLRDPYPLPNNLPDDRVEILLVTARPFANDVHYRSISRPLVDLVARENLPARVTILRPPTFDTLRAHLKVNPGRYHIVHFDGHGSYGDAAPSGGAHTLRGAAGTLYFETDDGQADPKTAEQLAALLREHRIPIAVLNACQSAMIDDDAADAFASVAASLLKAGTRSVVAMAYSLYVSGAQEFLPAFYRELFASGDVAVAVRAGRQQMLANPGRVCARGRFPLDDWSVPVVYQQDPPDLSFAKLAKPGTDPAPPLPEGATDADNPYGFVGRDAAVLELERAWRRAPAAILISGLGGAGKTTLARGFLAWLHVTDGLRHRAFWFDFRDIHNAEYVLNRLGEAFFGGQFAAAPLEERLKQLIAELREHSYVIVWDNFEVVRGLPDAGIAPLLADADQQLLKTFLQKLRGGRAKVLITSRSSEDWLGVENRGKSISLGGLQGEERWEFCGAILKDLGITINRKDGDLAKLMNLLDGHPLAMRVILPRLETLTAAGVALALQTNLAALTPGGDPAQDKLLATLRFAEQAIPDDLKSLLIPLALHEHYLHMPALENIARAVDTAWTRERIDRFGETLALAGLLRKRGQVIYEIHPALTGFLRATRPPAPAGGPEDAWARSFADIIGRYALYLVPRPLHEQRGTFAIHAANFHSALREAERLGMDKPYAALVLSLAAYAQNTHNFPAAVDLFQRFADHSKDRGKETAEAGAYHQLGMIAQARGDRDEAERWYCKSLEIDKRLGDEPGVAGTYHNLGAIAQTRGDRVEAERWYGKALEITERLGIESEAAITYHQLGTIAEGLGDHDGAKRWYRKSLEITERLSIESEAAGTYHHLGRIAQDRGDRNEAERLYHKSLEIKKRLGAEFGAAGTYHQLGTISQDRGDRDGAERWYGKSLEITERLGVESEAASTYHQLGLLAETRGDLDAAESWFRKALSLFERFQNRPHADLVRKCLARIGRGDSSRATTPSGFERIGKVPEEMATMDERIRTLDDRTALWLLRTLAGRQDAEATPAEVAEALGDRAGGATAAGGGGSEGDLARAALLVLAEDPMWRERLDLLLDGPRPEAFAVDPITAVAVVTAAIVVLQTRFTFERDKAGKLRIKIDKPAASDALLKAFLDAFTPFLGGAAAKPPGSPDPS